MISNPVTHLRSYTNSAIADIAGNSARSPTSPHWAMSADISASSADIVASNDDCSMMFHNVFSVSWCFTSGSRWFTMFYMCFIMFNNVLCFASRATIADRAAASGIATTPQGSAITPQKSAKTPQKSALRRRDRRYRRVRDPMLNSVLNGDWSNSVPGEKFQRGGTSRIRRLFTCFSTFLCF